MEKERRYQVFVSSTFQDLKEERRSVIEAILKLNCFPAGMELFPASNDEQFKFIKRVIDDSDYYVVIIGGRYGSVSANGISFTEREYDYARSMELPVLTFVHSNPGQIAPEKLEDDPKTRKKLEAFRQKVQSDKLVRGWTDAKGLALEVTASLAQTMRNSSAVGWSRGGGYSDAEPLSQINDLRIENTELKESIRTNQHQANVREKPVLAFGDDKFQLGGAYAYPGDTSGHTWDREMTWNDIFALAGPLVFKPVEYAKARYLFEDALKELTGFVGVTYFTLKDDLFQTIKIQLLGLNMMKVDCLKSVGGSVEEYLQLTPQGIEYLISLKGVPAPSDSEDSK